MCEQGGVGRSRPPGGRACVGAAWKRGSSLAAILGEQIKETVNDSCLRGRVHLVAPQPPSLARWPLMEVGGLKEEKRERSQINPIPIIFGVQKKVPRVRCLPLLSGVVCSSFANTRYTGHGAELLFSAHLLSEWTNKLS